MDRAVAQLVSLAFDERDPGAERAYGHEGVVGLGGEVRPGCVTHREKQIADAVQPASDGEIILKLSPL
jgi:hypothetical protein